MRSLALDAGRLARSLAASHRRPTAQIVRIVQILLGFRALAPPLASRDLWWGTCGVTLTAERSFHAKAVRRSPYAGATYFLCPLARLGRSKDHMHGSSGSSSFAPPLGGSPRIEFPQAFFASPDYSPDFSALCAPVSWHVHRVLPFGFTRGTWVLARGARRASPRDGERHVELGVRE